MLIADHQLSPTWTLNNHDCQRIVTRLGREGITSSDSYTGSNLVYLDRPVDLAVGTRRARALIGLVLALPGSVYLYQGEELGLPEVLDLPDEARQDPIFRRTGGHEIGRDGCRVPMPWRRDPPGAFGFSLLGGEVDPWLPQPAGWGDYSTEAQLGDDGSMLEMYRRLLRIRRAFVRHQGPAAEIVDVGDGLLGVRRGALVAVLNPTSEPVPTQGLDDAQVIATTDAGGGITGTVVPPDTTVWFRRA
jgi:alpha-glucosidase